MRKYLSGATYAAIVAAAILSFAAAPAEARSPSGSYRATCQHVRAHGDTVSAVCRRTDGSWRQTTLRDFDSCRGDIANINGRLNCARTKHFAEQRNRHHWGNRWQQEHGYGSSYRPGYYGGYYWYGR